jgi:hypothetical protein
MTRNIDPKTGHDEDGVRVDMRDYVKTMLTDFPGLVKTHFLARVEMGFGF